MSNLNARCLPTGKFNIMLTWKYIIVIDIQGQRHFKLVLLHVMYIHIV